MEHTFRDIGSRLRHARERRGLTLRDIANTTKISTAALTAIEHNDWRQWWKRRLVAIGLTVAMALFIIVSLALVLIGPTMALRVADWLRVGPAVALVWGLIRWPVIIACVIFSVDLVYQFAPNRRGRWAWITPGSVLVTTLWILSSLAFKLYLTNCGDYTATHGAIGGAIVTMLWFYVLSIAILVGAELDGVIEDAWRRADS